MKFEELMDTIPALPFKGYYVNKDGMAASLDDVPLISHIKDNLYVGGCIQGVDLGDFFSDVFSMYMWEKYSVGDNTNIVTRKMYDAPGQVDDETVDEVSDLVVEALTYSGNVLVHCQAGINRSNLIAGAALIKMGRTPTEAVALLREKRSPHVLANRDFYNYLMARTN